MKQPKFAVGEEVILQSKDFPELNGEDVVIDILNKGCLYNDRIAKEEVLFSAGDDFAYLLESSSLKGRKAINTDTIIEIAWGESALRKKHKPSDMSFKDLIQSINVKGSDLKKNKEQSLYYKMKKLYSF